MNNKGFTLVEMLVSFVLSMIIVVLLFQLIINLKDVYVSSVIKTELLNRQNLMTNKIYSDLIDKQVISISNCNSSSTCVDFTFFDGSDKQLIIDDVNNILSYDDYVVKLDNNSYFGSFSINTSNFGNISNKYNKIFNINVPILNDNFNDENFGINVVYMYDGNSVANSVSDYYSNFGLFFDSIDYIYSNGNQYINTNYMAKTNTEIQLDIQFIENGFTNTDTAKNTIVGGELQNNDNAKFTFNFGGTSPAKKEILYWINKKYDGKNKWNKVYSSVTNRSTFIVKSGTASFQGVTHTIETKEQDNTENMLLLGSFYKNVDPTGIYAFNRYDSKIYSFKILEGDTLVRDMVPVRRKADGVVGLYDKVNNVFYRSNSGTDFIYNEV